MQDRIRIKKIVRGVVQKANAVKDEVKKDVLNVEELIRQATEQLKRQQREFKNRYKNRNRR